MTKDTGDRSYIVVMHGSAEYSYPLEGEIDLIEAIHIVAQDPVEAKKKTIDIIQEKLRRDFKKSFGYIPKLKEEIDDDSYRAFFKLPKGVLHKEEVGIDLFLVFAYIIDVTDPFNPEFIRFPEGEE